MNIKQIKGLKYPDEYFIKFFFKNRLHEKVDLKYLEFGCGNGSNLTLPYQYDNEIIGIDYNKNLINMANENFSLFNSYTSYSFFSEDMRKAIENLKDINIDVLSLANVINYISKDDFLKFLKLCKDYYKYKENADFFIRFRTPKDFRFGFGKRIDSQTYKIDTTNNMTGEAGALNCFYSEVEMIDILRQYLNLNNYQLFHIDFENETPSGDIILNSDIVIWGKIN